MKLLDILQESMSDGGAFKAFVDSAVAKRETQSNEALDLVNRENLPIPAKDWFTELFNQLRPISIPQRKQKIERQDLGSVMFRLGDITYMEYIPIYYMAKDIVRCSKQKIWMKLKRRFKLTDEEIVELITYVFKKKYAITVKEARPVSPAFEKHRWDNK